MDRRFLGILAAIIIIFVGIFLISQNSGDKSDGAKSSAQPTNHIKGQGQSGVRLVEYGDFQCPVCATYLQPLDQIQKQFDKEIYFQFRHLPLSQIHPNAFGAARASEAAGEQGKFWEMYDKLYQNQAVWSNSSNAKSYFETYAKEIGLDLAKFNRDYASSKANDAINADMAEFDKTRQSKSTPTFFLGGKYLDNSQLVDQTGNVSIEKISKLIQAEIDKKAGTNKAQ